MRARTSFVNFVHGAVKQKCAVRRRAASSTALRRPSACSTSSVHGGKDDSVRRPLARFEMIWLSSGTATTITCARTRSASAASTREVRDRSRHSKSAHARLS
eukprot:6205772-Pleurochrysis_carterae.AAC.2